MATKTNRIVFGILGVLGEILITAGLLIAGFMVWTLWWDSNQSAAIAQEQVAEFYERVEPAPQQTAEVITKGEPPVPKPVGPGETIGVLIVPKWYEKTQNAMPVREGVTSDVLDMAAAGHYPETAALGDIGNFSLAGHRRSHGNSFRFVNELDLGDQLIVETEDTWYIYEMTSDQIVTPDRTDVVAPVPGEPGEEPFKRMMTLTTCHSPSVGEWGNSHRWIVHAELVGWMDRSEGTPEQILNDPGVN